MNKPRYQRILTVLYILLLILNSSSMLLAPQTASAETQPTPITVDPARPSAQPAFCGTDGNDTDDTIGVGLTTVVISSDEFGDQSVSPNFLNPPNNNPNGEQLRMLPGERIQFNFILTNSRAVETLTGVSADIILAHNGVQLLPIWDDPAFDGTLLPGETATGYMVYTAQATDPVLVDYTLFGWGTRDSTVNRCDIDRASDPNIATQFRVEGPSINLNLTVNAPIPADPRIEIGAPIQWTLTITNNRTFETNISSISDLYFEGTDFGSCSPPPGADLEGLLAAAEGTTTLGASSGSSLAFSFTCNMLPVYPDPVSNTVTVEATADTGFGTISDTFDVTVDVGKATPSISVVKFADATEATIGDTVTYTLRVSNDGDTTLNSVTVVDSLTQTVMDVPGRTLAVGESYEETVEYIVDETDADPLVNIVTAIAISPQGATTSDSWTLSLDKRNPAIELVMSVSPESAAVGEQVTYTFQVNNTSVESLVNVLVEFPLCSQPAGIVSGCSGDRVLLGTPPSASTSLLAGSTVTGTVVYELQPDDPDPFGFSEDTTAIARALTSQGSTVSDSASVFVDILSNQIQIVSSASRETVLRGDTITYTFSVTNVTGASLTVTSITDSILGAIGSIPPGGLVLAPDTPYEFEEFYTVSGSDLDPLVNVSTVTAAGDITDSTTTVVDISNAQLFIEVVTTPPDEAEPPGDVEYRIFISNNGQITLNDVTGHIQFVDTTEPETPLAIIFPDSPIPTVEAGILAPFELATATFNRPVQSDDPDPLTALVRIEATDELGLQRNFFGSGTINILPTRLQLRKDANATRAGVGDSITYEFRITNAAETDIVDISLEDPLCQFSEVAADSGCDGSNVRIAPYDSDTDTVTGAYTTSVDRLAPGDSLFGTFDYIVRTSDLALEDQLLVNTALASGTLESTAEPVGDASRWIIEVVNPLVIQKTADRILASVGQCATYTFQVANIGNLTTIENIVLTDSRLGDLSGTFPPFNLVPGESVTLVDSNISCTGATQHVVTDSDTPQLVNIATVTGVANTQILDDSATWTIDVTPPVIVTKSNGPLFGIAIAGDILEYTVNITNVSDVPYTMNSARDVSNSAYQPEQPINLADLANNSSGTQDLILDPGESTSVTYNYEVSPQDPDNLVNTFIISMTSSGETVEFSDTQTVEVFSPFGILKIPDRFFAVVGQTIHYDYLIYNISQITMNDVTVVDDRLGRIAVRLIDPDGTPLTTDPTIVPLTLPAANDYPCVVPLCEAYYLESDPTQYDYIVQPGDLVSDTLTNYVTVSGITTIDSVAPGTLITTTNFAEVQIANPLRITKVGPLTASRGDTVSYSVTITNISPNESGNIVTNIDVVDIFTGLVTMTFPDPLNNPRTLEPGESAAGAIVYTIPQNATDPLVNTITATGDLTIDGVTYDLTSIGTATTDLDDPILDVILTANAQSTERNTTITWTAQLANNGTSDLTGLTYTDSTGVDIGAAGCPSDLVAGAEPVFCEWQYTFTLDDPDPFENVLSVVGSTLGGDTFEGGDELTIDLIDPRFRVSKVAAPNVAFVGDTVTYTITVTNTSDSVLTNVIAFDSITGPVLLEFPSGIPGLLNNTETATAEITYTLSQADPNPLVNEVSASGISAAGGITLQDSTYTTVLITSSRLLVEKQASSPIVQVGDNIVYNIAITNIGQVPIRNIQIVDEAVGLDTTTDPNTCGGTVTHNGQTYDVNCTVDTPLTVDPIDPLNPFEVAFITYSVEATTALPDPFVNTAIVSGNEDEGRPVEGTDSIAVDIVTPGVVLTKTADVPGAAIDDTITYTVTLTNTSGDDLTNVVITDTELGGIVPMSLEGASFVTTIDTMANGETAIGIATYTVTEDTPNPFINTVQMTSNELSDGAATSVEIRDLGISVTKSPRSASALIGDTVIYDIEVQNTSSQALRAVTATDQLNGATIALFDPDSGDPITELDAGAIAIGTFTYVVPPDAPDPLVNRVSASGRADSGVFVSSSGLALVDIREADISLTKTATPDAALVGDSITYNFVVRNEGATPLDNVTLTDPLCASATSGCANATEVTLTFPTIAGELEAGEQATGQITRDIQPNDSDPLINTATAFGVTTNGASIQDSDSATVAVATSDLIITKTVAGIGGCTAPEVRAAAQVGDLVAYTVSVQNNGTGSISNIQVIDTLNGTDITSLLFPGVVAPQTPTLGPSGTVSTCIQTLVTNTSPDPLVNTVVATGLLNGLNPVTDTSTASIPITNSNLLVTNFASQPTARIGDVITYSVTVRNTGFDTLDNVTATSPQAGGAIALGTNSLAPGQSTTGSYTHTISGTDADPFQSTVIVTGIAPGPITLTDSATATVDLVADGIRLSKEAAPTFAPAGTDIVYTITVTNTGTTDINDFSVVDQLLGGDITGCFLPDGALPDPAPACNLPANSPLPLPPGASVSASIRRTLTNGDGDPAINTAVVTAEAGDPGDPTILSDSASASVNIAGTGLTVIKSADVIAAFDGDVINYTLEIINTSLTTVTGLTVTDTLVSGITLPRSSLAAGERLTTTYTHTVNTTVDTDPLINQVEVAGRDGAGVTVTDISSATVALLESDAIRVTLNPSQTTALVNESINYLATITNIGTEPLTGVTAVASLPDGSTIDLTSQLATTTLASGASVSTTFSYTVTDADLSPVVASVTAQGTGATAGLVSDTGRASVQIRISSIRVSASPNDCGFPCIGVIGDRITFTATVRNDGATTLTNVSLSSTPSVAFEEDPTGLILSPGDVYSVDFVYTVPFNAANPSRITLDAQGTDPIGSLVFSPTYTYQLATANPRIAVTLSADRQYVLDGETINFTAEIRNVGTEPLENLALADSLVGVLTDQITDLNLDPGQITSVTYGFTPGSGLPDPLNNTVTVSGQTSFGRAVTDNDTLTVNILRPQIYVTLNADRQVALLGEPINYTVSVVNTGDGPINNLRGSFLVDRSIVSAGMMHPPEQGGSITLGVTSLPQGAATSGFFSYIPTSGDPNPLGMRAIVSGEGLVGGVVIAVSDDATVTTSLVLYDADGNPINIPAPIIGSADPEVVKEALQPFAAPGGLVTWTMTVRNPGTEPLAGVIMNDTLDIKMTVESVAITNGTIQTEGNTIVAITDTLEFNETANLTIVARVNEGVIPGALLQNLGCATAVGGSTSVCDTAAVRVSPDADLLPATGLASPDSGAPIGSRSAALTLLLVLGLLGLSMQEQSPRTRVILLGVLIVAAVVIVVGVIGLAGNLGGPTPTGSDTATTEPTPEAVAQEPTTVPDEPTATEEPPVATAIPPTAIPIPTAAGALPPTEVVPLEPPFRPQYDRELYIPKLGISDALPIVSIPLRNQTWDVRDLGQSIGFLQGTTWLDEASGEFGGNTVLAAHIQISETVPGPFRDLDLLEIGDSIFVAEAGAVYEFVVSGIDVVAPDDIGVTYPTADQTLTLITCTTWNAFRGAFAERLVIRAEPVRSRVYAY